MDYNRLCLGCFKENKSGMAVCPYCGFEEKSYNEQAVKKMCLPAGTILQGRYLIGKVLGAGGFGITYLAFQMNLNRVVAIKELFPADVVMRSGQTSSTGLDFKLKVSGAGSMELFEKTLSGFETEGQNLASINLPGVVGIYDCFRDNSTAYLVMEYVSGQNLKEYQKEHGGRLEEKELLGLLEPVIRSMATIHDIGIIHRDISPDNLILNDKGELILVDFGAARSVAGVQDDEGKSLTVVLKQGYTPLEQYSSHGVQGPWTDVYALCATIYSLLTGRLPEEASIRIQDNNTDEDIKKTLSEAGVSRKTADAVTAGLKLLYSDRIQNMTDLWKALYGKAGGQDSAPSVAAKESIKAGGTKKSKKKGPFILLILLAGVIAVGAFLVHRNLEIKRESERQELERIAVEQAEAGKAESEKRAREKEQSEAESERKAKAKAESESESEKIARAKAESESESEKAARLQAEWERAAKEKAESEAESERKARVKAESESESERMARAKAESEAESARVAEKKKESEAESEQKAKEKEESEAESEKKAKEKAESESESEKKAREKRNQKLN